jgi:hypothetical protein
MSESRRYVVEVAGRFRANSKIYLGLHDRRLVPYREESSVGEQNERARWALSSRRAAEPIPQSAGHGQCRYGGKPNMPSLTVDHQRSSLIFTDLNSLHWFSVINPHISGLNSSTAKATTSWIETLVRRKQICLPIHLIEEQWCPSSVLFSKNAIPCWG